MNDAKKYLFFFYFGKDLPCFNRARKKFDFSGDGLGGRWIKVVSRSVSTSNKRVRLHVFRSGFSVFPVEKNHTIIQKNQSDFGLSLMK